MWALAESALRRQEAGRFPRRGSASQLPRPLRGVGQERRPSFRCRQTYQVKTSGWIASCKEWLAAVGIVIGARNLLVPVVRSKTILGRSWRHSYIPCWPGKSSESLEHSLRTTRSCVPRAELTSHTGQTMGKRISRTRAEQYHC